MQHYDDLISIIVPMYNCEQYITRLIESMYNQINKNFELILVNDGSTDRSLELAKSILEKTDVKYKIINQENSGVSVARNSGIKASIGKYIYFLDADDFVENNFCEVVLNNFNKHNIDMIMFDYNIINNYKVEYTHNNIEYNYSTPKTAKQILEDLFMSKIPYHMCGFVVKKDVIEKNKITFTVDSKYGEDHEFLIKTISTTDNIIVIPNKLYNYCKNETSVTSKFNINRLDSIASALRIKDYINKLYCNVHLNNLVNKYICNKLIYNIDEYITSSIKKDDEFKNIFINYIKLNKGYFKYYSYNESECSIKRKAKGIILNMFPELYIRLLGYKKESRKKHEKNIG